MQLKHLCWLNANVELNATATRAVSLKPHTSGRISLSVHVIQSCLITRNFALNQLACDNDPKPSKKYNICTKCSSSSPFAASLASLHCFYATNVLFIDSDGKQNINMGKGKRS